jgi:regulator of RNase E activity RraA
MQPLPTAAIADACLRLGVPIRVAPAGLRPARATYAAEGTALPAQHVGSVDVFLEAFQGAKPGDVLVVDNGGRLDEGCVGDLTGLEARLHGVQAIVVWGVHRDDAELARLGIPVWSLGANPCGPQRLDSRAGDALERARLGPVDVRRGDAVFADADGVLLVAAAEAARVREAARAIVATERKQADLMLAGTTLSTQVRFDAYLEARKKDPTLTFRAHLRSVQGAIEV